MQIKVKATLVTIIIICCKKKLKQVDTPVQMIMIKSDQPRLLGSSSSLEMFALRWNPGLIKDNNNSSANAKQYQKITTALWNMSSLNLLDTSYLLHSVPFCSVPSIFFRETDWCVYYSYIGQYIYGKRRDGEENEWRKGKARECLRTSERLLRCRYDRVTHSTLTLYDYARTYVRTYVRT